MMTPQEREAWAQDGFFIRRGMFDALTVAAVEAEVIGKLRSDPPTDHPGAPAYAIGDHLLVQPEAAPSRAAVNAEDFVAKVFNCHAEGLSRDMALTPAVVDVVADLLGEDIDVFQSQFIFKNPGVIGQPWHQDSFYFEFDKQPQIGVWVALSAATLENGCLWVAPGSQSSPILPHLPDARPEANAGYLEVFDADFSNQRPVLMNPGDVLFFHSFLLHRSTDNVADHRRAAMVYHFGRAGTAALDPRRAAALARVNRWIPARRAKAA